MRIHLTSRGSTTLLIASAALGGLLWLGTFACSHTAAAPPPPLPQSPWGGRYAYTYDLPANLPKLDAGSVPITIAVVNPSYKEADSSLASTLYSGVGKGLTLSMGTDLDKLLIHKGVTTTGPFPGLDEITYSEKKGADLTLAPKVFISVDIQNGDGYRVEGAGRQENPFVMNVTGWISFIMQEPMTGEKMWIKKLEIEPVKINGIIAYTSEPQYSGGEGCGGPTILGYHVGTMIYDGRADALATALKDIYPVVLGRFYKYLETEEMVQLKAKAREIRANKVYAGN